MTKYYLHHPIYSLLLILLFFTSCNGQSKMQPLIALNTPTANSTGQPKLMKTQGANEYQTVDCAIQDKNSNIWFGTTGEGVYKYDGKLFTQYTIKDGLSSNCVWSILEDKAGNIWFGTTNGICRYNPNFQVGLGISITTVSIPFSIRPVITDNSYYSDWCTKSTVWSMLQDKSGTIWFGTGDGVYCFDPSAELRAGSKNFTRFLSNDGVINKDSLHLKLVADILQDKNGIIWFASGMPPGYEGFSRYDGKTIVRFKPKNEGWIRNVIESKTGNLLLATRHFGVWAYDGRTFTDYTQPKELINGSLNYILEDKAGHLWVASDYGKDMGDTLGGLWRSNFSIATSTPKTFTKITNKEVYFMMEDKDSNIWFGTRGVGLYRIDACLPGRQGKTVTKFSE